MRDDDPKFRAASASIAVVARETPAAMRQYWTRQRLPYLAIPDPAGRLGKLYGQRWRLFKLGLMPALFVIDRQGAVMYARYGSSMCDIPDDGEVLEVLQRPAAADHS
jgi:peroxiredoxin